MKRSDFIVPPCLDRPNLKGRLASHEGVRQADSAIRQAVRKDFERFREARRKALEEAVQRFLD